MSDCRGKNLLCSCTNVSRLECLDSRDVFRRAQVMASFITGLYAARPITILMYNALRTHLTQVVHYLRRLSNWRYVDPWHLPELSRVEQLANFTGSLPTLYRIIIYRSCRITFSCSALLSTSHTYISSIHHRCTTDVQEYWGSINRQYSTRTTKPASHYWAEIYSSNLGHENSQHPEQAWSPDP